jgi:hypothetical protein
VGDGVPVTWTKEKAKEYHIKNNRRPDAQAQRRSASQQNYEKNKKEILAREKVIRATLESTEKRRSAKYKRLYGITTAIYDAMLAVNNGGCWICGRLAGERRLSVDHERGSGKVRGILCYYCNNKLIGRAKQKDCWKFQKAIEYLNLTKDWRTHGTSPP